MNDTTELQANASATHGLSSTEGAVLQRLVTNNSDGTRLDYIDPEATMYDGFDKVTAVSGYVAAKAFNDICKIIGGRWPDAKMQQEAPEAYRFFMALF